MDEVEQDTSGFVPLYGVAQAAGFVAVVLTGVWMGHFRGGFGWDVDYVFNWHPLLMVLGMVYLYGNGESDYNTSPSSPTFHSNQLLARSLDFYILSWAYGCR